MIIDKFENLPLYFSCLPGLDKAASSSPERILPTDGTR